MLWQQALKLTARSDPIKFAIVLVFRTRWSRSKSPKFIYGSVSITPLDGCGCGSDKCRIPCCLVNCGRRGHCRSDVGGAYRRGHAFIGTRHHRGGRPWLPAARAIRRPGPVRARIPAPWSARWRARPSARNSAARTGSRIAAGVAGAAIGGLIGNRIGAAMDDEDKRRAYDAQMDALEGGAAGRAGGVGKSGFRPARHHRSGTAI